MVWNNPKHSADKEALLLGDFKHLKFQYESGKEGTPHYQGQFTLKCQKTLSALKTWFYDTFKAKPHFEKTMSIEGSCKYVGKEDGRLDGPWEIGKQPKQGNRCDLHSIRTLFKSGSTIREVWDSQEHFTTFTRNYRSLKEFHSMVGNAVRSEQTQCYVYWGSTGCGKSEAAKAETEAWGGGTYWLGLESGLNGKVWWDGYNGEHNIVIDEFHCQMSLTDLKKLIDSTPYRVPTKGGTVQLLAKRVWILSNTGPDVWYFKHCAKFSEDRAALNRRLHYVEQFKTRFQGEQTYDDYVQFRKDFVASQQSP